MRVGEAKTPDGMRLYAIGDVHGCDDLLAETHERIAADLAARPIGDHRIIHVGDYADRGPDSAAVIARLAAQTATDPHVLCLRGNHDELLVGFLDDPFNYGATLLGNGGEETLRSYGVMPTVMGRITGDFGALSEKLSETMPAADQAFLRGLPLSVRFGDYFFCHAGIRPGVALDDQDPDDLTWIREEFLRDDRDHGVVVVHGHTPAIEPEVKSNRINVDTGAVFSGRMSCAVLEGTEVRFL
jgi:diadenosine tetraphosphatase ApaH/serine/threonine PP2A family protein phosphatase